MKYHFRWNIDEIDDLLAPNTIRITSIREPLSCFRSVYNYFYYQLEGDNFPCDSPCWYEPYMTFMNGNKYVPFPEYLNMLPDVFDGEKAHSYRSSNYQAFEMGMDHLDNDAMYIMSR